jgi:hypothetical protein
VGGDRRVNQPVSIERLQTAILVWETTMDLYKDGMESIKRNHRLTWWMRPGYWANEKQYHKLFTGLIRRRIQLQTAIKEKESSK